MYTKRVTSCHSYRVYPTKSYTRSCLWHHQRNCLQVIDPASDALFIRSVFTEQHGPSLALGFSTTESSRQWTSWISERQNRPPQELLFPDCHKTAQSVGGRWSLRQFIWRRRTTEFPLGINKGKFNVRNIILQGQWSFFMNVEWWRCFWHHNVTLITHKKT